MFDMQNKTKWTIGFLSVTGLAIIMELFAAFDNNWNTAPWTLLIIDNIPPIVGIPAVGLFSLWLFTHFIKYYKGKGK